MGKRIDTGRAAPDDPIDRRRRAAAGIVKQTGCRVGRWFAVGSGVRAQRRRLELLWDSIEDRYGLLSEDEACVAAGNHALQATGILPVIRNGESRYPGFQFTGGSIRTGWHELTEPLLEAGWHPEDVLLWFAAPTGWLNGRTPADLIDEDLDAVRSAVTNAALGPAD